MTDPECCSAQHARTGSQTAVLIWTAENYQAAAAASAIMVGCSRRSFFLVLVILRVANPVQVRMIS